MKPNELRIGNWITKPDGREDRVGEIYYDSVWITNEGCDYGYNIIKPVKLTEEWLEMFGFEYWENPSTKQWQRPGCWLILEINLDNNKFIWEQHDILNKYVELDYVHQLQNLYFALTGNELEIK